jgi:hypothetical protein
VQGGAYYNTFACNIRGENGQPLITLEWFADMRYHKKILSGDGYLELILAERVYCEYIKAKDELTNTLLGILQ